jgi:hypothetical protein
LGKKRVKEWNYHVTEAGQDRIFRRGSIVCHKGKMRPMKGGFSDLKIAGYYLSIFSVPCASKPPSIFLELFSFIISNIIANKFLSPP